MVWDLPKGLAKERKHINRAMHSSNAIMVQHSLWRHDDLKTPLDIALKIKQFGGKARILEERFLF